MCLPLELPGGWCKVAECSRLLVQGTENAMMSTTTSRSVATQYSTSQEAGGVGTVFKIRVGAVDRPASVQLLSQFPGYVRRTPRAEGWVGCCLGWPPLVLVHFDFISLWTAFPPAPLLPVFSLVPHSHLRPLHHESHSVTRCLCAGRRSSFSRPSRTWSPLASLNTRT